MSAESHHSGFFSHGSRPKSSALPPSAQMLLQSANRHALLGEDVPENKEIYKNMVHDPGTPEDMQELQQHAVDKSEETTSTIHNCIRVAEDMRQEANKTIVQLHEQGQQIRRTHDSALILEQELSKGEKLLASLGGIFSKPWRPKRGHELTGPMDLPHGVPDNSSPLKGFNNDSRCSISSEPEQTSQFQSHVQKEKRKQEEALSDLSNVLDQLKAMSVDMGQELHNQNQSLGRLHEDVSELEFRVRNANERGRQLLHR